MKNFLLRTRDLIILNFLFQAISEKIPVVPEVLGARRNWRDECLTSLAKMKKQMKSD